MKVKCRHCGKRGDERRMAFYFVDGRKVHCCPARFDAAYTNASMQPTPCFLAAVREMESEGQEVAA